MTEETTPALQTIDDIAQDLGISPQEVIKHLKPSVVIGHIDASHSKNVVIAQGQKAVIHHEVYLKVPEGTTLAINQKEQTLAEMIEACQNYKAGKELIDRHTQTQNEIEHQFESLARPVVHALGKAIKHNVENARLVECLKFVTDTLTPFSQDATFDRNDATLGRGAYLIVFSAFALATAYKKYDLLKMLMESPVRYSGLPDLPLGGIRAYFFQPTSGDETQKQRFYATLFNTQTGWLMPLLPPRANQDAYLAEADFIADVAFAYACKQFFKSTEIWSYGGAYITQTSLSIIQDWLKHEYHTLKEQKDSKFETPIRDLAKFYAQSHSYWQRRLSQAIEDVI